jgi:hypothetical protein
MTRERLWPALLLGWLLAAVVLCVALAPTIVHLRFPDPDDAMRLLEVRDWIAGQSWWDVGQHRLNGGVFPMHWSRLVDLPLAAVLLVFDPLVGTSLATRLAMTLVPMLTLLAVMASAACMSRRLGGTETARLSILLAPLSIPLVYQIRPLRIDHHGWQIALATAAVALLTGPPTVRRGLATGLSLAMLVTISMEGLPIAAAIAAVAALGWAFDPRRRGFVVALIGCFFLAALALHVGTRGPAMFASSCDAMSPGWLALLGVAAGGITAVTVIAPANRLFRIALLGAAGVACLTTLRLVAPACLEGPFARLEPLVRAIWYDSVREGLPIWEQSAGWAAVTIALPLVGLFGSARALRGGDSQTRTRWLMLIGVLAPATILACLVNRAGGTANALALPGAASLLLAMLTRARAVRSVLPRIAATAGALLVASPGLAAGAVSSMLARPAVVSVSMIAGRTRPACETFEQIRDLRRLSPATVFLPLDVTPDLIATTPHQAIAGGYHRNSAAMHRVLAAFTGSPDTAEGLVRATRATYVAGCPGLNETELYKEVAPDGLWARLERGERIAWLEPVAMPGSPVLVWRVIGSSRRPLSRKASRH